MSRRSEDFSKESMKIDGKIGIGEKTQLQALSAA
jgi:hypothetical protein